jgi:hypothetical protein
VTSGGCIARASHRRDGNDSKLETNKTLVRKFVDVVKNQRKLDQLGEFFAADYREHNETVAAFGPGIVGYQNFLGHLFSAFPDQGGVG